MDEIEIAEFKLKLHLEILRKDIQKCVAQLSAPMWKVWITRRKKSEALKFFKAAFDQPEIFYIEDIGLLCTAGLARVLLGPGARYGIEGLRYMRSGLTKTLLPALLSNDQHMISEAKQTVKLFRKATKSEDLNVRSVAALVIGNPEIMNADSI